MKPTVHWYTALEQLEVGDGKPAEEAFKKLSQAFFQEPHLLNADAASLKLSLKNGLAIVGISDGQIIAYARLTPLAEGWFELGSTFVSKSYRGEKLNHEMYRRFLPLHQKKNILATTTNPASLRVGQDLGFVVIPREMLPEAIWRSSCVCPFQKTGAVDPKNCRLAKKPDCFFRITQETAERLDLKNPPPLRLIIRAAVSY